MNSVRVLKPRRRVFGEKQQRFPRQIHTPECDMGHCFRAIRGARFAGFPSGTFPADISNLRGFRGEWNHRTNLHPSARRVVLDFRHARGDDEPAAVPRGSTWLFDRTADATILAPEKK